MVAAMDATGSGVLTGAAIKWVTHGFLPTFASPVMDRERLYTVDNSAILGAFDLKTGKELWTKTLGTLQKGSPVLADGKLYVGTENGKFYILRPTATGAEVLDEDLIGTAAESRADRRVARDRRRPHLRDDDAAADEAERIGGTSVCDRHRGAAPRATPRRRRRRRSRRPGRSRRCRCSRTKRCSIPAGSRRSR